MAAVSRLRSRRRPVWRKAAQGLVLAAAAYFALCAAYFVYLRSFNPPFTTVQLQRRAEAWLQEEPYRYRSQWTPIERIPKRLQYAVIASEDVAFHHHYGIDWLELKTALREAFNNGELGRGASTITQQLVKNLLLTTHRSLLRKGVEFALTPLAELILPKRRILELYLNVIEWGPGVWGAQAAAQHHYGLPVGRLSREQAARLAACIPAPLRRRPEWMDSYSRLILARMQRRGW